jgi:hypothetical protein
MIGAVEHGASDFIDPGRCHFGRLGQVGRLDHGLDGGRSRGAYHDRGIDGRLGVGRCFPSLDRPHGGVAALVPLGAFGSAVIAWAVIAWAVIAWAVIARAVIAWAVIA